MNDNDRGAPGGKRRRRAGRRPALVTAAAGALVFSAGARADETATHANAAPISIPNRSYDSVYGGTYGPGAPYPSTMVVAGRTGRVTRVTVELAGLSHTYPADMDVLLVGPQGQKTLLMSDMGGKCDVLGVTLTLDDAAPASLPWACGLLDSAPPITSGTYRPTDVNEQQYGVPETFAGGLWSPAPPGPYSATLSVFYGTDPNGVWSLYAVDDWPFDVGSLAEGWSLTITTTTADIVPPTLNLPNQVVADAETPDGAPVSYTVSATDDQNPSPQVDCTPLSGSTFAIGTTTVTCTASDLAGNTSSGTFSVHVKGASEQINDVRGTVNALEAARGIITSLNVKLLNALDAIAAGNTGQACQQLDSFISEAHGLAGQVIPEAEANELVADAQRIQEVLAC